MCVRARARSCESSDVCAVERKESVARAGLRRRTVVVAVHVDRGQRLGGAQSLDERLSACGDTPRAGTNIIGGSSRTARQGSRGLCGAQPGLCAPGRVGAPIAVDWEGHDGHSWPYTYRHRYSLCESSVPPRATDNGNLLTTEHLFWHCGAHTAEPKIVPIGTIPPIPCYQNLLFSVARGWARSGRSAHGGSPSGDLSTLSGSAEGMPGRRWHSEASSQPRGPCLLPRILVLLPGTAALSLSPAWLLHGFLGQTLASRVHSCAWANAPCTTEPSRRV